MSRFDVKVYPRVQSVYKVSFVSKAFQFYFCTNKFLNNQLPYAKALYVLFYCFLSVSQILSFFTYSDFLIYPIGNSTKFLRFLKFTESQTSQIPRAPNPKLPKLLKLPKVPKTPRLPKV